MTLSPFFDTINYREVIMAKWDKEYLKLCKKILEEGKRVENRTGIDTIKIPSYNLHFDLEEEFPILTTKQLFFKNAITEILWIWQAKSNDVRWLRDRNNNIWNEWEIDEDGIYRTYKTIRFYPGDEIDFNYYLKNGELYADEKTILKDLDGNNVLDETGNLIKISGKEKYTRLKDKVDENGNKYKEVQIIKEAKYYGEEYAHTIGTAYGYIVDRFNLIDDLINTIKNNPNDRRMVKSLWQDDYLKTAVLPSCVWATEWDVTGNNLNLMVHQRSCDVPLGLPFNVTQYATLLYLVSQVTNKKPGTIDWSIKDAHIYTNQIEGIKEQIRRGEQLEDLRAPELWINPEIKDFYDFDNSSKLKDIKIREYKHHGPIKFPIAQ